MLFVDRGRVAIPSVLLPGGAAEVEKEKAAVFYKQAHHLQSRFEFKVFRSKEVKSALYELFQGKCAWCESRIGSTVPGDICHYRPKGGVAESRKHPGYWWLASQWENLLLSCPACNRPHQYNGVIAGKSSRFPLEDEAQRAFEPGWEEREKPLLLDPTSDDPARHFVYDWEGNILSETPEGQMTITIIGLNRPALVEARKSALAMVRSLLKMVAAASGVGSEEQRKFILRQLQELTADNAEYAAIKRQLISTDLKKIVRDTGYNDFYWLKSTLPVTKKRVSGIWEKLRDFELKQSDFSLLNSRGIAISRSQSRKIQKVTINNFKGIDELTFNVASNWQMLLGENGAGKSSVLQAIALCLGGADNFAKVVNENGIDPKTLIRSKRQKATIEIQVSGFVKPHMLNIYRDRAVFLRAAKRSAFVDYAHCSATVTGASEARNVQFVLLGYGATRLLKPAARLSELYFREAEPVRYARFDNLFDPLSLLISAEEWLLKQKREIFDLSARALKDLLGLDNKHILSKRNNTIMVVMDDKKFLPLAALSDGYKTVIALCVDILAIATEFWGDPGSAEGIVLVDELDCHLHPTWKMRIVSALKRAFPEMQFICTTHDPLCLRGLGAGEVCVMQRDGEGINLLSDLPNPADFRVEQLLTSAFFGLNSTQDPENEAIFDEYYALLALPDKDREQSQRLEQLKAELEDRRYFGDTPREQMMFNSIDHIIAERKKEGLWQLPDIKENTKKSLSGLWNSEFLQIKRPKGLPKK
ncbi:AAA family ATPase [Kosakonia pseudosacchari]|uniref:AAA family ATPase n=1 Tax=Kosakonia pseudosacchari TaxID=1646340 RepID=UPI0022F09E5D|nr:AAA family ATPase [Kosakonia pseudosacchari]WBU47284.1 AAA family ATPase [Kosakonia pseudosacchari]